MTRKTRTCSYAAWIVAAAVITVFLGVGTAIATSPAQGLPSEKAALWNRIQQEIIDARAHAPPKPNPSSVVLLTHAPYPTRVAGIYETHQGPFSNINFRLNNMWEGPVGADWVQAYAGAEHPVSDPESQRGALRLDRLDLTNGHTEIIGVFDAPT